MRFLIFTYIMKGHTMAKTFIMQEDYSKMIFPITPAFVQMVTDTLRHPRLSVASSRY